MAIPVDEYPKEGLGVYDDFETCEDFSGYVWATWTTMTAQPMQLDSALQALLNPSAPMSSGQKNLNYDLGTPANLDLANLPTGSNEHACGTAALFPDSVEDVTMDSGVDKRSRESPDSTLKPEGKSLKTSEATSNVAATDADEAQMTENAKPSTMTRRPSTIPEAKSIMWEVHNRMPAWKAEKLIESLKSEDVNLVALGEATRILFESKEMWCDAVQYLEKIRKEKSKKGDADSGVSKKPESCSSQSSQDVNTEKESNDVTEQKETTSAPARAATTVPNTTGSSGGITTQAPESSSKSSAVKSHQPDANASSTDLTDKEKKDPVPESHEDWFTRVTKAGQEVVWHPRPRCPTLLTGVQPSNLKSLETLGWEDKLESADLEKHGDYLRGRQFLALPHPLEAIAWENGFVPETHGLPPNELEPRMLPLLPQLSHMVSAPRQPVAAGNSLLTRFDANIRPYWLRDWQTV